MASGGEVKPLLDVKVPVPSDIDIAQSIQPKHISTVADDLGILPEELDLYGTTKAKVRYGIHGKELMLQCCL
jgi:hypothetical protein